MDFKETMERYKKGEADQEERNLIEGELEKLTILESYLAEQTALDLECFSALGAEPFGDEQGFENHQKKEQQSEKNQSGGNQNKWAKNSEKNQDYRQEIRKINRRINGRIFKSIFCVFIAIGALAFLTDLVCDAVFYNPNKGDFGEAQFYVDTSVFVELNFPGYMIWDVSAESDGPGAYSVFMQVSDTFHHTQSTEATYGRFAWGRLRSIEPALKKQGPLACWPTVALTPFDFKNGLYGIIETDGTERNAQSAEEMAYNLDGLKELPPHSRSSVYLTFQEDLTLEELSNFCKNWDPMQSDVVYAGVRLSSPEPGDGVGRNIRLGFRPTMAGRWMEKEQFPPECLEKYPNLVRYWEDRQLWEEDWTTVWEQHFCSMLGYMADREAFLKAVSEPNYVIGGNASAYQEALTYVKEHGIKVYGILFQGDTETILDIYEKENIDGIYVNDVKLSVLSR